MLQVNEQKTTRDVSVGLQGERGTFLATPYKNGRPEEASIVVAAEGHSIKNFTTPGVTWTLTKISDQDISSEYERERERERESLGRGR